MAKKGLEYVCYAELQEDGSYTNGQYMGASAKFTATATTNTVKDYGDNGVVATDTSVTNGTVTVEANEMENKHYAKLLGHTYDAEKDQVTCNSNDIAPYVGIGCIGMSTAEKMYKAVVYKKTQFKEPGEEYDTKGDSTTFTHSTLEGDFYTLDNGDYSVRASFATRDAAKKFIDDLFKIGTAPSA